MTIDLERRWDAWDKAMEEGADILDTIAILQDPPHYHPCGHCKQRPTGFACFNRSENLLSHEGLYQVCLRCDDVLVGREPDDGRESIAPGDYQYFDGGPS